MWEKGNLLPRHPERKYPMSLYSNAPPPPLTVAQIDQWITNTSRKRLDVHVLATEPWDSPERAAAFIQMSELLLDAIEEVRVISASLREGSQQVRHQSADLRAHALQLIEQGTRSMERLSQWAPPPEEMPQAESQRLDRCRDGKRQAE
jgi:hypothetical protein